MKNSPFAAQMLRRLPNMSKSVGWTTLIRLDGPSRATGCEIYGKCEWENPGGSVKDRAAKFIIEDAERTGKLPSTGGGVIVEGTAGNTGIGLSLFGNSRGHKTVIVMPDTQSQEKKDAIRFAGATLLEVLSIHCSPNAHTRKLPSTCDSDPPGLRLSPPSSSSSLQVPAVPYKNENNYVHVARRLSEAIPDAFLANQWDNLANRQAHVMGTGPEIWHQMDGRLDAFSCAMGTGGTLTGTAEFLRSVHPGIKIGLTDPRGAVVYRWFRDGVIAAGEGSSISEGIGQGRLTGNMAGFTPDLLHEVRPVLHRSSTPPACVPPRPPCSTPYGRVRVYPTSLA